MTKSIAFHSYKGGTGKTTLAVNLASLLAKRGSRVFILDLDVYAPSLQSYFGEGVHTRIKKYFNDYIGGGCEVEDLIFDLTPTIKDYSKQGRNLRKPFWLFFQSQARGHTENRGSQRRQEQTEHVKEVHNNEGKIIH